MLPDVPARFTLGMVTYDAIKSQKSNNLVAGDTAPLTVMCFDQFSNQVADDTQINVVLSGSATIDPKDGASNTITISKGKTEFGITSSTAETVKISFEDVAQTGAALPSDAEAVFYMDGNFLFKQASVSQPLDGTVGNNIRVTVEVVNRAGDKVKVLNGEAIEAVIVVSGSAKISAPVLVFSQGEGVLPIYSEVSETVTVGIKDSTSTGFSTVDEVKVTYNAGTSCL